MVGRKSAFCSGMAVGGWGGAFAVVLSSLTAASVRAQTASTTLSLTARVRPAIVVTPQRNLDFGGVIPGTTKTIAVSDATSGRFRVRGENSAAVLLSFTLPTHLVSSTNQMPIGGWTGSWNQSAAPTGGSSFSPSMTPSPATLSSGAGQIFVHIGGQVSPPANQAAGVYTATITLTVDYP